MIATISHRYVCCSYTVAILGVGDSSVVEPAPQDTQVLRGCGFGNPTESSCWAILPEVCSDLSRNQEQSGAAYDSLALKARLFLSVKAWRQSRDSNT